MKPVAILSAVAVMLGVNVATHAPPPTIDLDEYALSFAEDFDQLSVSAWGDGKSRWIAHTPWAGDFGDAAFSNPRHGFPFTIHQGVLRIEATRRNDGKWRSGLLSAMDPENRGFCQEYGYFEARMKMPPGKGVWPAFWLMGRDKSQGSAEIDVVEYYGHDNSRFESVWHVWMAHLGKPDLGGKHIVEVPAGTLSTRFHTYGVDVSPDVVTFYFDRKQTWQIPTPETFHNCFYPLVNLALGSGWPIDETPDPSYLWVDYIHVYSRMPGPTRAGSALE